ncbi:MAG TPA: hypothetical protein VKM55_06300 [Candidatus Lokiarchaeia archaeon]|nr:hypothetical protein [Candidatus Lokiarchaeia archaeon]
MILSNDDARKAVFSGFDGFQEQFFATLATYSKASTTQERTGIATRFVKEVVIPYLDTAKDSLLKEYSSSMRVIEGELSKLLDVFGEACT